MGSFPISGNTGAAPLSSLSNTRRNLENQLGEVEAAAENLPERLPNTEGPAAEAVETPSAARLDDPDFQNRVSQREVGGFDPENGLVFDGNVDILGNTSPSDLIEAFRSPDDDALHHPLMRDHSIVTGSQVEAGYQGENWRVGLRVDADAAVQTEGVDPLVNDLRQLETEGKKVMSQMRLLQRQVGNIQRNLNQSPELQRMNQIVENATQNPAAFGPAEQQELQTLLASDNVQALFTDMNEVLDNSERLMGAANETLGIIGDGTRRLQVDMQARGAAEVFAGYRSDAIDLGDDWQMQMGAEATGIVPIPVGNVQVTSELPAFRTAMHKVSTEVQVTVSGIEGLQDRLNGMQAALQSVQGSVTAMEHAGENLQAAAESNDLPTRLQATQRALQQGNRAINGLSNAGRGLSNEVGQLADSLNDLDVKVSATLRSVEADPGIGIGLRDVSVRFQGPLNDRLNLDLLTGARNALGYLSGTERVYDINVDSLVEDQDLALDLRSQTQRNVYYDMQDPALYQGVHLDGDLGAYGFDLQMRAEMSLTDPEKVRAGATLTQHIQDFSILTGISNSDVFGSDSQAQYQVGLSYANSAELLVETDSFSQPGFLKANLAVNLDDQFHVNGAMIMSTTQVNGSTQADYAGVLGFGGSFFPGGSDD